MPVMSLRILLMIGTNGMTLRQQTHGDHDGEVLNIIRLKIHKKGDASSTQCIKVICFFVSSI